MDFLSFGSGVAVGIVVGYLLWAIVIPGMAAVIGDR